MSYLKILISAVSMFGAITHAQADSLWSDFEGVWVGKIEKIDPGLEYEVLPEVETHPQFFDIAIDLSEDEARVYVEDGGAWVRGKTWLLWRGVS